MPEFFSRNIRKKVNTVKSLRYRSVQFSSVYKYVPHSVLTMKLFSHTKTHCIRFLRLLKQSHSWGT